MAKGGLFSFIFNAFRATSPTLPSGDALGFEVVGEAAYQHALDAIAGGKTESGHNIFCIALLIPEPLNLHDPNAVMVRVDGSLVGYLSRSSAITFRRTFGQQSLESDARIIGGWKKGAWSEGHYGIRLEGPLRNA